MRSLSRIALAALAGAAALAACGAPVSPETRARAATASAVPGVETTAIIISDITTFPGKVVWRATAAGRTYACDADDRFALPDCRPEAGSLEPIRAISCGSNNSLCLAWLL